METLQLIVAFLGGGVLVGIFEWIRTRISEKVREIVLNPKYKEMDFTTEVLLFMTARAQLYFEYMIPALKKIHKNNRHTRNSALYLPAP